MLPLFIVENIPDRGDVVIESFTTDVKVIAKQVPERGDDEVDERHR